MREVNLAAMVPSLEASRECPGWRKVGITEGVVEREVDLGVRIRIREPSLGRNRGRGWRRGGGSFEAEFIVINKKLVRLKGEGESECCEGQEGEDD